MKTDMPDYVIVDHERATFFAERREPSEYTEGYYNVYELDPRYEDDRNHYCVSEEYIHEIDWSYE